MFGDIDIWKIIHFNAQVLDIQTIVETWSCVYTCTMSSIQDMCDPQPLQTAFVHCNASSEKKKKPKLDISAPASGRKEAVCYKFYGAPSLRSSSTTQLHSDFNVL